MKIKNNQVKNRQKSFHVAYSPEVIGKPEYKREPVRKAGQHFIKRLQALIRKNLMLKSVRIVLNSGFYPEFFYIVGPFIFCAAAMLSGI
jgi:hypothetical protein